MLINKSNYEFFALDYLEGNLNATELQTMRAFLQAHPDIDAELEIMKGDLFTFEVDESVVYEHKDSLLKEETPIIALRPKRWYKMAAAAAIAILLIGFGAGYFSAQHLEKSSGVANLEEVKIPMESQPALVEPKQQELVATIDTKSFKEEERAVSPNQEDTQPRIKKAGNKNISRSVEVMPDETIELAVVKPEEEVKISPENTIENTLNIIEDTENRVVALAELPRVAITITVKSKEVLTDRISLLPNTGIPKQRNRIATLASDNQITSRLNKVKGFLGKLPFEDATLEAFVPTYFAGE